MTATILPGIVQLPFGLGNLVYAQWLAIEGLSGLAPTEDVENVCAKGFVFIDRPRRRGGDDRGGGADGGRAVHGLRRLRGFRQGGDRVPGRPRAARDQRAPQ